MGRPAPAPVAGTTADSGLPDPGPAGAGPVDDDPSMSAGHPTVVLAAHGTRDPEGAPVLLAIAAAVRERLSTRVEVGWLSTGEPAFGDLVGRIRPDVVVPLLLGTGYHVLVDIPGIVTGAPRPATPVVITPHLGPAREVVIALAERIRAVDPEPIAIVLAAAGTSHPVGRSETRQAADLLSQLLGVPVRVAYASGAGPDVTEAVRALQESGARRVTVVPYLLAPGFFADRIRAGADSAGALTAEVLGAHPAIVDLVVRRVSATDTAIPPAPEALAA